MLVPEYAILITISCFQRVGGFDVRNQIDTMAAKMTGKIRNVTCVMQELGYVSVNYLLLYTKIKFDDTYKIHKRSYDCMWKINK